jgi:hypothetical protein
MTQTLEPGDVEELVRVAAVALAMVDVLGWLGALVESRTVRAPRLLGEYLIADSAPLGRLIQPASIGV